MHQCSLSAQDEVDGSLGKRSKCAPEFLLVLDLGKAEKKIVKIVQRQSFPNDESTLKGRLARLKPFEEDGILRVGGRLKYSDLQYGAKHPMILPEKHPISELIIRHYHHLNGTCGNLPSFGRDTSTILDY